MSSNETEKALSQISYCTAPDWIIAKTFDPSIQRLSGEPITQLLLDEQHDADSMTMYRHSAERLENMQAVQSLSQWQLDFDPFCQSVQLHSLVVHRGDEATQYASPEKPRILHREGDLDSFIISGNQTILILLEDIRPGDVVESIFSITTQPQLLPESFTCFHATPSAFQIGKHHFRVRFSSNKKLQWRSSQADYTPAIKEDGSTTEWTWERDQVVKTKIESNIPEFTLPPMWIQITDLSDWSEISAAILKEWPQVEPSERLQQEVEAICGPASSLNEKVEALIRHLQDDYRYLSVKTVAGGQIPQHPEEIIRRRYGDCKDLSLLLSSLINTLGVNARPIIVHESKGKILPDMLPSPSLFNHAIVAYELEGTTRWVDPTLKQQGGNLTRRYVPTYHFGLIIDPETTDLTAQPKTQTDRNHLQLHDTLMLDTAGNFNILRIQTVAGGYFADSFREQLANEGHESFNESCKIRNSDRYELNDPIEEVKYEDDRDENIWRMVEIYKLAKLQNPHEGFYQISLPPTLPQTAIPLPDDETRQFAYAISNHLNITHIQEIRFKANQSQKSVQRNFAKFGVKYSMKATFSRTVWKHEVSLQTDTDSIPPENIKAFRTMMVNMLSFTGFNITAPQGNVRMHRDSKFFELPKQIKIKPTGEAVTTATTVGPRKQQHIASHPDKQPVRTSKKRRSHIKQHSAASTGIKGKHILALCLVALFIASIVFKIIFFSD
jgi:hypothetical protein